MNRLAYTAILEAIEKKRDEFLTEIKSADYSHEELIKALAESRVAAEKYQFLAGKLLETYKSQANVNEELLEVEKRITIAHRKCISKIATDAKHERNRKLKIKAFEWYKENKHKYRTQDAIADAMHEIQPYDSIAWRTLRDWITDFRKNTPY